MWVVSIISYSNAKFAYLTKLEEEGEEKLWISILIIFPNTDEV